MDSRDEFYVGYAPGAPPGLRRFLGPRVGVILGAVFAAALGLAWAQRPPADAVYEYGMVRSWTGTLMGGPLPLLVNTDSGRVRTWLLAGQLKRGAAPLVAGFEGRSVRLQAVRLARGQTGMLEVHAPPEPTGAPPAVVEVRDLGPVAVTGEIMDGKCWTGAMNPGQGATHRLCARRCLLGGLPPLLVGRDEGGREVVALLATRSALAPDSALAPLAPLAPGSAIVTGRLHQIGTLMVLETDATSIRRAPQ